jgi:hypothetical protein
VKLFAWNLGPYYYLFNNIPYAHSFSENKYNA